MLEPRNRNVPRLGPVVRILYLAARSVVMACLVVMILLVVIDVVGRSFTGSGLPGTIEINEYLLIVIGFLGIFQTHHEKGHVAVDLLFDKLPLTVRRILDRVNNGTIMVFSLIFMYAGVERLWASYQAGETNWFGPYVLPVWFVRMVVPIGCLALCLQSLVNIRNSDVVIEEPGPTEITK